MEYLIAFLDNNRKPAAYTWEYIHELYRYLEMIGPPTTLTTSGQRSNHFDTSSYTKNDTETIQTVIAALHIRQTIICKIWGNIGHKDNACIIHGPKLIPPSLRKYMNQFNGIHGDEPTDPPRKWNIQPPEAHFKYKNSPPKPSPVVSDTMGILNHYSIDNGGVEVHP